MLFPEQDKVDELVELVKSASPDNLGDVFARAVQIRLTISNKQALSISELPMSDLRKLASRAEFDWKLFENPDLPEIPLDNNQILQLVGIEYALHELCYCCQMVDESASITWAGSSPTRFYLNGVYHYVSSMFLVDTSKNTHRDLAMGGTVIRAFHPMGLTGLLSPINEILQRDFGELNSFGESILKLRHSHLVHGDFSPERYEFLVIDTKMRDPKQKEIFAQHVWDLFHELLLLDLKILAILSYINPNMAEIVTNYLNKMEQ